MPLIETFRNIGFDIDIVIFALVLHGQNQIKLVLPIPSMLASQHYIHYIIVFLIKKSYDLSIKQHCSLLCERTPPMVALNISQDFYKKKSRTIVQRQSTWVCCAHLWHV